MPKSTDLIIVRGKLTTKRLKLYRKIVKAYPDTVFIYQSFSVDHSSEVLKYFSKVGLTQVSYMADLCVAKDIKVAGKIHSELQVGRLYLYNAGVIDTSKFVKTPLILSSTYIYEILKYFKPKCVSSINDSNGVSFDACRKLKIKSFTHTIYPSLALRLERGFPEFKPSRNKLI